MEIISELEGEQRGVYAGAVGYFSHSGNQETAIALRTMVIKDGRAYVQAGGGVVADSIPANEYQESLNKAKAQLRALDEAENIAHTIRQQQSIEQGNIDGRQGQAQPLHTSHRIRQGEVILTEGRGKPSPYIYLTEFAKGEER
jgi:hypothetical protein